MSGFSEYDVIKCVLSVKEMVHLELKREDTGLDSNHGCLLSPGALTLRSERVPETPVEKKAEVSTCYPRVPAPECWKA